MIPIIIGVFSIRSWLTLFICFPKLSTLFLALSIWPGTLNILLFSSNLNNPSLTSFNFFKLLSTFSIAGFLYSISKYLEIPELNNIPLGTIIYKNKKTKNIYFDTFFNIFVILFL